MNVIVYWSANYCRSVGVKRCNKGTHIFTDVVAALFWILFFRDLPLLFLYFNSFFFIKTRCYFSSVSSWYVLIIVRPIHEIHSWFFRTKFRPIFSRDGLSSKQCFQHQHKLSTIGFTISYLSSLFKLLLEMIVY